MQHTLPTTLAALTISTCAAFADGFQTGQSDLIIQDQTGSRHITGHVWYPTDATTGAQTVHGNKVWKPISVHKDAEPSDGQYPLVVVSHGMYGGARNQAWFAQALTNQGYIVVGINHPGTSFLDQDPDHAREMWRRPQDISRTIDALLADPDYADHVDPDNIFMAGHSLGGFTAIALAGGRFDPDKYHQHCNERADYIACRAMHSWNVAVSDQDRIDIAQDMSDSRIKGFAVFDLGGAQTFSVESLGAIDTPMVVYGAEVENSEMDLDLESRALMAALPDGIAEYFEPAGMSHFDFMGECMPNGLEVLKKFEPQDVYVCENGTDQRAEFHRQIIGTVTGFFDSL